MLITSIKVRLSQPTEGPKRPLSYLDAQCVSFPGHFPLKYAIVQSVCRDVDFPCSNVTYFWKVCTSRPARHGSM